MPLDLPKQLGVTAYLFEEMGGLTGHFLCLFGSEEPVRSEGPVEHPDHLDPLGILKMKQNVLAYDQAEAAPDGIQRKKIVLLKLDSASQ
jgi:hypothetical protein